MASTYLSLHYHLVFATKNREAVIAPEWRSRLHEYLGGIISGLGGFPAGRRRRGRSCPPAGRPESDSLSGGCHAGIEKGLIGMGA